MTCCNFLTFIAKFEMACLLGMLGATLNGMHHVILLVIKRLPLQT